MALKLLVGTVLGFLTGLGIGGGSLLILWLTVVLGFSQDTARGINLLFFLPCALTACLFRLKQGKLDLRRCLPAILAGTASAAVFSVIVIVMIVVFSVIVTVMTVKFLMYAVLIFRIKVEMLKSRHIGR